MKFKYLNLIFFTILLIILSLIIFFSIKDQKNEKKRISDMAQEYLLKMINSKSDELLSLSLALSDNGDIKDSIIKDDELKANKILSAITKKYERYTKIDDLKLQIITTDGFLFARSWDSSFSGFPLSWVRDDIDDILKNNQPKSGIELGMFLTIRATTPIYKDKEVIGYIEAIKQLNDLTNELRSSGIELIILMKNVYLKEASLMRDNLQIENFVVANSNASSIYLDLLGKISLKSLEKNHFIFKDNILYIIRTMNNTKGKKLGYFILAISPDTYQKLANNTALLSFMQNDFSHIYTPSKNHLNSFYTYKDQELIETLPKLNKRDRVDYINRAREKLNRYKKSQLIDIILQSDSKSKKIGEIR